MLPQREQAQGGRAARLYRQALLLLTLLLSSTLPTLAQCAMCAATVESNAKESGKGIANGLNTGILYLMVTPYILFTIVGVIWYRSAKRKKKTALK